MLAVIVAVLGPAVSHIPLTALRVVVGALLLVFGLQWLRKAILRASGHKALHDEDRIYAEQLAAAQASRPAGGRSWRPTGTASRWRSRACCWRAWRSCSSC